MAVKVAGVTPALPGCAAKLAALIPRERLDPAVLRWADASSRRATWSIAFSGGPDSLALLLLVWAHWPDRRGRLRVLHFNHRLRGTESQADVVFCRRIARELGVAFVAGSWGKARLDASEAEARAARMAFFASQARIIWFGHQQDDVAETMLMRLARGSGTGGLAAPRPVQIQSDGRVHLRPLLGLKKEAIVTALRQVGVPWRVDSTNRRDLFFRNRVRRKVVPLWTEASKRDALAGAARSRLLLEEDDAALEAWVDGLNVFARRGRLDLTVLAGMPRAVYRRALHRWILKERRAGDLSRQAFEALLQALENGKPTRHSLGRQGFAVTDGSELWFEPVGKKRRNFHRPAN